MTDEAKRSGWWAAQQSASTRRQLILAAMRSMAEKGVEGVSLRSVNVAAGARNTSAAHYHFGNKLGLLEGYRELTRKPLKSVACSLQWPKNEPVPGS